MRAEGVALLLCGLVLLMLLSVRVALGFLCPGPTTKPECLYWGHMGASPLCVYTWVPVEHACPPSTPGRPLDDVLHALPRRV